MIAPAAVERHPRPSWRAVAVPTEHGGWGLTAEPVLLGLLVVASPAGLLLGLAALLAFVARTPAKVVLVDRWRGRTLDRTRLARRIAAVELALLAGVVVLAAILASERFWVPLLVAAPLVGIELWFDMRSRSRRLVPELAGTIGIGSVAAAIILAGGGSAPAATLAWAVIATRAVASLPFVRYQLRRAKGRPGAGTPPQRPGAETQPQRRGAATQPQRPGAETQPQRRGAAAEELLQVGVAVAAVGAGLLTDLPWAAAGALVALAAVQLVLARIPPPRAAIVGAQQLCFGLVVAVTAGLTIPPT